METQQKTLAEKWQELTHENPHLRIRNAAAELNVSEAELLATQLGKTVIRLRPEFDKLMAEFESLGFANGITRNESIVHERKGVYLNYSWNPHAALFVGEDIDLRFFPSSWKSCFAVIEGDDNKQRRSIQLFDKYGYAVHKVYLTSRSDVEAFNRIVEAFKDENQEPVELVEPLTKSIHPRETREQEPDFKTFKEEWINLKDTHHFFGMINKHKLHRIEALENAPSTHFAEKIGNDGLRKALLAASSVELPIMVFVGNRGAIGIHTGPVKKIVDHNEWLNVLDPDFNLHIRENDINQTWIVRKPTEDGEVTSIECFDAQGELIITLFGKRKPGIPEMHEWRELVKSI
jgi:putative hemin transport protein